MGRKKNERLSWVVFAVVFAWSFVASAPDRRAGAPGNAVEGPAASAEAAPELGEKRRHSTQNNRRQTSPLVYPVPSLLFAAHLVIFCIECPFPSHGNREVEFCDVVPMLFDVFQLSSE